MFFKNIDAPQHFDINAPRHFLQGMLSRVIGMTTSQPLSSCPAIWEYLCPGHTVNSSICFSVRKICPPQLNRMSASLQICAFCLGPVLLLTPRAKKWLDKSLLQAFTGRMVTSSCPGAGPQGESSETTNKLY